MELTDQLNRKDLKLLPPDEVVEFSSSHPLELSNHTLHIGEEGWDVVIGGGLTDKSELAHQENGYRVIAANIEGLKGQVLRIQVSKFALGNMVFVSNQTNQEMQASFAGHGETLGGLDSGRSTIRDEKYNVKHNEPHKMASVLLPTGQTVIIDRDLREETQQELDDPADDGAVDTDIIIRLKPAEFS